MNYLVTGGAGFIGSHLVDRLISDGHRITVVDNLSTGKKENLQIPVIEKDICDNLDDVFAAGKFDAVFHLAALPLVQYSIEHPAETDKINTGGALNVLETARKFNVGRFIFTSSSATYGDQDSLPIAEITLPEPASPYGIQKLTAEYYCRFYHRVHQLKTVSLRLFSVYGPRQSPNGTYGVVARFISLVNAGEPVKIFGDGNQTRDFVFVSDVVRALVTAAATDNDRCFGEIFNIGTGVRTSINELAETIIAGKDIRIEHPPAMVEQRDTQADITKAANLLNWQPKISLEEGIAQITKR